MLADDDNLLVSNTGQTMAARSNVSLGTGAHYIVFDTGPHPAGYALTSVEITLETTNTTAIDVPDMYLATPAGDVVLDGPASLEPNTTKAYTYTAPAGATLSPSSTNLLAMAEFSAGSFNNVYWRHTASTAEDAASAPGWTIADEGERGSLNSVDTPPLLLRVNGSPVISHAATDIEVSFGAAEYTAVEGGTAVAVEVNLSRARPFTVDIPLEVASSHGALPAATTRRYRRRWHSARERRAGPSRCGPSTTRTTTTASISFSASATCPPGTGPARTRRPSWCSRTTTATARW